MADSLNSAPIWMWESWHQARTAQCTVALREWEHTAEQKSEHKEWFTLRSRWGFFFLNDQKKKRVKPLLSTYCTARFMVHVWICK